MALAEVDEDADPLAAALLHSKLAYNLWTAGDSQASLVEHRRAVGLVPPEPPTVERARVVGGLASALMPAGHYRESRELCEQAIATLRAAGSHDGEARLLNVLGVDLVGPGRRGRGARPPPGRGAAGAGDRRRRQPARLPAQPLLLPRPDRPLRGGRSRSRSTGSRPPGGSASSGAMRGASGEPPATSSTGRGAGTRPTRSPGPGSTLDEDVSGWIYLQSTRACSCGPREPTCPGSDRAPPAGEPAPTSTPDVRAYLLGASPRPRSSTTGRPTRSARSKRPRRVRGQRRAAPARAAPRRGHDRRGRPRGPRPGVPAAGRCRCGAGRRCRAPRAGPRPRHGRQPGPRRRRPGRRLPRSRPSGPGSRARRTRRRGSRQPAPGRPSRCPTRPRGQGPGRRGDRCSRAAPATRRPSCCGGPRAATDLGATPLRTAIESIGTRSRIAVDTPSGRSREGHREGRRTPRRPSAPAEAPDRGPAEILGL